MHMQEISMPEKILRVLQRRPEMHLGLLVLRLPQWEAGDADVVRLQDRDLNPCMILL